MNSVPQAFFLKLANCGVTAIVIQQFSHAALSHALSVSSSRTTGYWREHVTYFPPFHRKGEDTPVLYVMQPVCAMPGVGFHLSPAQGGPL